MKYILLLDNITKLYFFSHSQAAWLGLLLLLAYLWPSETHKVSLEVGRLPGMVARVTMCEIAQKCHFVVTLHCSRGAVRLLFQQIPTPEDTSGYLNPFPTHPLYHKLCATVAKMYISTVQRLIVAKGPKVSTNQV